MLLNLLASFLARVVGGDGTSMDGGGGGGGGIVGVDFVFKFGCLPVVNVSPAVVTELPSTAACKPPKLHGGGFHERHLHVPVVFFQVKLRARGEHDFFELVSVDVLLVQKHVGDGVQAVDVADDSYTVEKIKKTGVKHGVVQYLVKWALGRLY